MSQPEGARIFVSIEDLTPLTEIATAHPLALEALLHAWLNSGSGVTDKAGLRSTIDKSIGNLISSFKGTDAVTLLDFLANLLLRLEPEVCPLFLFVENRRRIDIASRSSLPTPPGSHL